MVESTDLEKIVKQVAEEVIRRLSGEQKENRGALVVFPDYVFDPEGISNYLKTKTNVDCALLNNAAFNCEGCTARRIENADDKRKLASELMAYSDVIIVTPPLSLVRALAKADDSVYEAMLMIRPLLWGKAVTVLLDFDALAYKRNSAFSQISEDLTALETAGVKIVSIKQKTAINVKEKDLVTEQDVKEAHKNETMRVTAAKGAIITQLAEDTARELGVSIER
jgi:hypothetical protein